MIYYWAPSDDVILMLLVYAKSERDDLTPRQLDVLASLVTEEFR